MDSYLLAEGLNAFVAHISPGQSALIVGAVGTLVTIVTNRLSRHDAKKTAQATAAATIFQQVTEVNDNLMNEIRLTRDEIGLIRQRLTEVEEERERLKARIHDLERLNTAKDEETTLLRARVFSLEEEIKDLHAQLDKAKARSGRRKTDTPVVVT